MTDILQDSNLVRHARREMEILGCQEDDILDMLSVVSAFASICMSGSQAAWHIALLPKLLQFQNLTPLTDNPDEWNEVGPGVWQSSRCAEAFSEDGGRTYTLLSENKKVSHVASLIKKDADNG